MKDSTTRDKYLRPATLLILLGVWHVASALVNSEILLPSPAATLKRLGELVVTETFWLAVMSTLRRGLTGFALSLLVGLFCGLLAGFNQIAKVLMQPFVLLSRSTPLMSIILLALIWFRSDQVPVFVAFLVCFPVIFGNVFAGVKNVDNSLLEMARVHRVGWWATITGVYLPSIAPYILAGASTAMGLGLKVVVAAEALSQPKLAIGTRMQVERMYLETAGLFAWTITALFLSWLLEYGIRWVEKRVRGSG
ncbi:MAG: NitT/TauT family transport system permease protein [Bacillota bacterium]|nr:MAG: NitT/TauT family transport system permease protein [Bacillota bacterium]